MRLVTVHDDAKYHKINFNQKTKKKESPDSIKKNTGVRFGQRNKLRHAAILYSLVYTVHIFSTIYTTKWRQSNFFLMIIFQNNIISLYIYCLIKMYKLSPLINNDFIELSKTHSYHLSLSFLTSIRLTPLNILVSIYYKVVWRPRR